MKPEHPRLIVLDRDIDRIRLLARDNAHARKILGELEREADRLQSAPVVEYKTNGSRLLAESRQVLDRVYTLALLHRLDGKRQHFERAVRELHSAASFRNWNPSYFIDAAEMTHAFAIGYDWLYESLDKYEKAWMRQAIIEKGLNLALPLYERQEGWVIGRNSSNIACNGGMTLGALAIADEEPEKCGAVLKYALESIPRAISSYAPDGGWPEGPAYWHYATRYTVCMLAALDSALGSDFGLSNIKGFDKAGRFRVYFSGPVGKTFNFADARDEIEAAPEMFWLARRFNQPVYAWQEQQAIEKSHREDREGTPLDLVWYQRDARPPGGIAWPLDAIFAGVQCAFFRSSWEDPNGLFLAAKGGDNKAGHAHLDLGSFVFDAGGVRWAVDPGPEDYNLPGYFGRRRWSYYRARTESHNTLLIDDENQDPKAEARITRHEFGSDFSWVQIDLSRAYPGKVKTLQRRIGMAQRQAVLIQDRLEADQPVEALWGMLTDADVSFDGQSAVLQKEGWTLAADIRTPRHAVFDVLPSRNSRERKLVVRLGEKVSDLDLNVVLAPYRTGQPKPKTTAKFPA
ncbi:MAG: heparinase II/III family protein [Acidobacteriota bacterium]|nr:heparinase II/III family protein [Acidobacteriota bacterium]